MEQNLKDIPIINLPVSFNIQKMLIDAGMRNLQDIADFCSKEGRLIYVPGILLHQERKLESAMASFGVEQLMPLQTCEEWLAISYPSVSQAWAERVAKKGYSKSGIIYIQADKLLKDKQTAKILAKAGLNTIGDCLIHWYLKHTFRDIKGIGIGRSDDIIDALDSVDLTKDIDLLDGEYAQYIRRNILNMDVSVLYTNPDTVYDMHNKGFLHVRDLDLYMWRGHTVKDLNKLMFSKLTSLEMKTTREVLGRLGNQCSYH